MRGSISVWSVAFNAEMRFANALTWLLDDFCLASVGKNQMPSGPQRIQTL